MDKHIGQAATAAALFIAIILGVVLAGLWFQRNRAGIVEQIQRAWDRVLKLEQRYPRAWAFVSARFARGEYLGLHLTIGFAISLAGLWLFGAITEDVIHHDPLTQLDLQIGEWFRAHATPDGYATFGVIAALGSSLVLAVVAVGGSLVLALRRHWVPLAGWLAAYAGALILNVMLKFMIRRPRPLGAYEFLSSESWSFPSGHAMGSLIGYGMLAYLLITLWTKRRGIRIGIALVAIILIAAIGLSRLYLGVHYLSDVMGGYAAGTLWLAACTSGVEVARRWKARPGPLPDPAHQEE